MPTDTNKIIEAFEELLNKKNKLRKPLDRFGLEKVPISRGPNESMSKWEKAAAILMAALSPASTIASMVLSPPQKEDASIFDRQIINPDGSRTFLPEVTEAVVPKMKKVQREAIKTLQKFPNRERYLGAAGSDAYSFSAKKFGTEAPASITLGPKNYTGTTYIPSVDAIAEYRSGKPIGTLTFDKEGKVNVAGVLPEYQGRGIGKDLYKKAAMLGKNIYEIGLTSQDAAKARYAAIQELASGKFSQRPKRIDKIGQVTPIVREKQQQQQLKDVNDWNRMLYVGHLLELKNAYSAGEITAQGYIRGRQLLDSGKFKDVAASMAERAKTIDNPQLHRLLSFLPK